MDSHLSSVPANANAPSVQMNPGLTEFDLTPLGASSRARTLESSRRAALGAPEAANVARWSFLGKRWDFIGYRLVEISPLF